jgi:hypothetical protein
VPPPDGTPQLRSPGQLPGGRAGNGRETRAGLPLPPEPDSTASFVFPWSFVAILALLVCMAMYAWLWIAGGAPVGAALYVIPVLVALTAPILYHAARTERRFDLAGLLALGLVLRFVAMYYRFDHAVDARTYNLWGTRLAESFRELNFAPDTNASVPGTGTMRYISGLAHLLSNDDELGAFLILTWLAFLGCYLLYRAFVTAVPDGDRYRYAVLLFFWPSLVLWPSSIGKEAVILFSIGLAALGAARLFTRQPGGYTLLFLGVLVTYLVRPHVALILLVALGFALVVGRGHARPTRALTPASVAKVAAIVLLLAAMSVVATRTANYLGIESLQPTTTDEAFEQTQQKTAIGGSEFTPADATNPIGYPQAAVTILFRPFPFEVNASDQLAASLEALALAFLMVVSWRRLLSVPSRLRVQPYVGLSIAFILMFFFVFAAISNFGIIARERIMMLPFVFVLVSVAGISVNSVARSSNALPRRSNRSGPTRR